MTSRSRRLAGGALGLAVLASMWLAFAPRHLPGGSASYVVPSGTSMLPLLQRGDLVVTREADRYETGDVVAYQSRDLQTIVLHRIIRVEAGRYVLKGDNNDFIDSDRPTESELIGRLWLRVPAAGNILVWLRAPQNAAMLAGGAAFLLVGGLAGARVRRGRRRRPAEPQQPQRQGRAPRTTHQTRLILAATLGAAVLGFGALGVVSFNLPLQTTASEPHPYTHAGTFQYTAAAPRGEVYADAEVATGEPVFLRLVPKLSVRFDYRIETQAPHTISGTTRLDALLSDETGWSRTIELQSPTEFVGSAATLTGTLDLREVRALMLRVEELTRIRRSGFVLTLVPRIDVAGTIAAQAVRDTFSPELRFLLDPLLLRVDRADDATEPTAATFERGQPGFVTGEETVPKRLEAFGIGVEVTTARRGAVIGLGVSILLGLFLAIMMLLRRPREEPARISARYGHLLVPVEAGDELLEGGSVEVSTIDALVQVAQRYERSVLHVERDGAHTYLVEGDVVIYRYRADPRPYPTRSGPAVDGGPGTKVPDER